MGKATGGELPGSIVGLDSSSLLIGKMLNRRLMKFAADAKLEGTGTPMNRGQCRRHH